MAAILLTVFFVQAGSSGKIQQPIAFNHKKHFQNNVSCDVCHPLYTNYSSAGIPGVKVCLRCHEEVINRMPEKDKIQNYRKSGQEIPWVRVHRIKITAGTLFKPLPAKTFAMIYGGSEKINFSHRRHVIFGKVDCSECHGNVAGMEKPFTRPFIEWVMDSCISCHETKGKKVSVDCATCHR
ncbi:MAG: cytochrome c3 family protein [Desulfobacterales bacterium]|nr:cytochrome c3 family protein [Desulfobacterales bacterium]